MLLGLLLGVCVIPGAGCDAGRPDVLLVTFDTTRYDRVGFNGDPTAHTPVLDDLATRSHRFARAYASSGLTLPSHATILTGLEPFEHGIHSNIRFRLPDERATLAELFADHGYATAAFVSASVLDRQANLAQGFDVYGDSVKKEGGRLNFSVPRREASEVVDEALQWLASLSSQRPYFLWVHFYDPHRPWDREWAGVDAYAAGIAYADQQLGRLLDGISRERSTEPLLAFTADHGEGLGEHGEETHGIAAYDSTLHVPLLVRAPGAQAGVDLRAYARHIDIVPTLLAAARIEVPGELRGRDLLAPEVAQESFAGDVAASPVGYFESRGPHFDFGWSPVVGVRAAEWKYTGEPAPAELYDTRRDPGETRNLAAEHPEIVDFLSSRLDDFERRRDAGAARVESATLDLDEQARLAALGYIEVPRVETEKERLRDPRALAQLFSWVDGARTLALSGDFEQSIDVLETFAHSPTVRPLVLRSLAPVYAEAGRHEDAIRTYEEYIELTGALEAVAGLVRLQMRQADYAAVLELLDKHELPEGLELVLRARALARSGRLDESLQLLRSASGKAMPVLAAARLEAEMWIEAAPQPGAELRLRQLLDAFPEDPELMSWLGYYLAIWADDADSTEARLLLYRASEEAPDSLQALANAGWGAFRLGDIEGASRRLQDLVDRDPSRYLDVYRLARVEAAAGNNVAARGHLSRILAMWPAAPWFGEAAELRRQLESAGGGSE